MPIAPVFDGAKFFTTVDGKRMGTILLVTVVVVESTDVVFALDSIPAVLGITTDKFIVYTSNVFAIMGLRMLYFLLANIMGLFHLLKYGLALILAFVAVKLIFQHHPEIFDVSTGLSLAIIAGCLVLSVIASVLFKPKELPRETTPDQ
jgi:tellurite resistance protein TerC